MIARLAAFLGRYVRQPDKVLHLAAGAAFGGLLAAFLGPLWALWLGAGLSWAKERRDKAQPDRHTWDGWDAFATLCGVLLGVTLAPYVGWVVRAAIAA